MNICFVCSTPFPPVEGISSHIWYLSKFLVKRGHTVEILTRSANRNVAYQEVEGVLIRRIFFLPVYPLHVYLHGFFVQQVVATLEKQTTLFHIHSPLPPVVRSEKSIALTLHAFMKSDANKRALRSYGDLLNKLQSQVSFEIEKDLIRRASGVVFVANQIAMEADKLRLRIEHSTIIPNGVDTDFFVPTDETVTQSFLLFVGRLDQGKGIEYLLDALASVKREFPDTRLKIVGEGNLRRALMARSNRLGLGGNVEFLGRAKSQEMLRSLYQSACAVICPSVYESGPRVVLEAMSCGTPVVSTKVGIAPEVISDGINGLLVDHHSSSAISAAICRICSDGDLRSRLAAGSRDAVVTGFSLGKMGSAYLDFYNNLLLRRL